MVQFFLLHIQQQHELPNKKLTFLNSSSDMNYKKKILTISQASLFSSNGDNPVSNSNKTTPKLNVSNFTDMPPLE